MTNKQISVQQLPLVFHYVIAKGPFLRDQAFKALVKEFPDFTDGDIVDWLMEGLKEPARVFTALSCLGKVEIPVDTNLEPLKEIVRGNGGAGEADRRLALSAFRSVQHGGGEPFLLDVLRRTHSLPDIKIICEVLGDIGTWHAFPVLMARLDAGRSSVNEQIYETIDLIGKRAAITESFLAEIKEPSSWKMKWGGAAKDFISMMEIFAVMSGVEPDDTEKVDLLAEIYMDAMEVDLSPYQTYRELRLCTSADNSPVDIITTITDQAESMLFLEEALSGTAVTYSEETQFDNIHADMQTDYFITRLRRWLKFPDDDY